MPTALAETARGRVTVGDDYLVLASGDRLLLVDGSLLLLATSAPIVPLVSLGSDDANGNWDSLDATIATAGGSVTATAGVATGSIAGLSATTTVATTANAATLAGEANTPQVSIGVSPEEAEGSFDTLDAEAATTAEGVAVARPALGAIAIGDATHRVAPTALAPSGLFDTNDATAAISSPNPDPNPYAITYALVADPSHALDAAGTYIRSAEFTYRIER